MWDDPAIGSRCLRVRVVQVASASNSPTRFPLNTLNTLHALYSRRALLSCSNDKGFLHLHSYVAVTLRSDDSLLLRDSRNYSLLLRYCDSALCLLTYEDDVVIGHALSPWSLKEPV